MHLMTSCLDTFSHFRVNVSTSPDLHYAELTKRDAPSNTVARGLTFWISHDIQHHSDETQAPSLSRSAQRQLMKGR